MWHRLSRLATRPTDPDPVVVDGPPKLLIVAVAAGMIVGALVAPAETADADGPAATAADAAPAATFDHWSGSSNPGGYGASG